MKKFAYIAMLALLLVAQGAFAVNTMSALSDAGTVTQSPSLEHPQWLKFQYTVPSAGITGAVDVVTNPSWNLPKGAVILEDSFIEVETAVLPAAGTAALAVGGVTFLSDGNILEATGIDPLTDANLPNITTAADKPYITVTGTDATQGVFTVYLNVLLGNAR